MREYSKVSPCFWMGGTGKAIIAAGDSEAIVALYLMTAPTSNMIGLYYLPIPTLMHETGRGFKGASKALRSLSELGFAYYDEVSEVVFIPEMATYQIGEVLDPKDKRIKGIVNELEKYRKYRFAKDFYEKYKDCYNLPEMQFDKPLRSPFEAPSKPLRSQEQEQEQEQEIEQEQDKYKNEDSGEQIFYPISIPLADNSEHHIPLAEVDELKSLFPTVDVEQSIRSMRAWCLANPKQRKTKGGAKRFIAAWLERDRSRVVSKPQPKSSHLDAPLVTKEYLKATMGIDL